MSVGFGDFRKTLYHHLELPPLALVFCISDRKKSFWTVFAKLLRYITASLVAQMVKNLPTMWEAQV